MDCGDRTATDGGSGREQFRAGGVMAKEAQQGYKADALAIERFTFETREDARALKPLKPPAVAFRIRSTIDRAARVVRVKALLSCHDPEGEKAVFVAEARIRADFSWVDPVQIPVEDFARLNAAGFLWPYARELVWNFTVRSNLPPLLLPILNFAGVTV